MDYQRANELLSAERLRIVSLLTHLDHDAEAERSGANAQGDMADSAESLVAEQESSATEEGLRLRLASVTRAEQRVADGTFGFSVRSGEVISDERLEADPAAELTIDEASQR